MEGQKKITPRRENWLIACDFGAEDVEYLAFDSHNVLPSVGKRVVLVLSKNPRVAFRFSRRDHAWDFLRFVSERGMLRLKIGDEGRFGVDLCLDQFSVVQETAVKDSEEVV